MSPFIKILEPQIKEGSGFFGRFFGRGDSKNGGSGANSKALNLDDIQGFILRGYRMPLVRHFLLSVVNPAKARELLGRFVNGNESDAPQITTAKDWHIGFEPGPSDNINEKPQRKPDYCLNIGITWSGMLALEIDKREPTVSFKSFNAFTQGAAERAKLVGDSGPSDPQHWVGDFGKGDDHVLVTLHAINPEALNSYSEKLSKLFIEEDAFEETWRQDGAAIIEMVDGKPTPTAKVHFGYTDGLSMTNIKGGPEKRQRDLQKECESWIFVLQEEAENYIVPQPLELGLNGSFAVFKMIETDVVGFENMLQSNKDKIDPELLAAKICGRWRNGVPLMLSPDTDKPSGGITPDEINNFDYIHADGSGDPKGQHCPVGAHMRRINPRGQPVPGQGQPGGSNTTHRLVRRGLPYGPVYDPTKPYDNIPRGLLGYFINTNIENQYEFVLGEWVNKSEFAGSVRLDSKSKDPMIGTQDPNESVFDIPRANGAPPIRISGFSGFVKTMAAAYCFLPSVTAIKFISKL
jgi:deferrochelatase/peroxidase EfeB